jgi:hypothetical protein
MGACGSPVAVLDDLSAAARERVPDNRFIGATVLDRDRTLTATREHERQAALRHGCRGRGPWLGDTAAFNLIPLTWRALTADRPRQAFGDDNRTRDG